MYHITHTETDMGTNMLLKDYIKKNHESIADFARVHQAKPQNIGHRADSGFIIWGDLIYSPKPYLLRGNYLPEGELELVADWINRNHQSQYAFAKEYGYSKQKVGKWVKDGWVVWNGRIYSPRMKINSDNTLSIKGRLVRK